jgi:transposase
MIALPAGVKVWLAAGATDMRKGFDGLAALVLTQLAEDPFSGQLFVASRGSSTRIDIASSIAMIASRRESSSGVLQGAGLSMK